MSLSNYGREKGTCLVDGCKKKHQKRGRWSFLSFKFQKALNTSEDERSSGLMVISLSSSLSYYGLFLLLSCALFTVPSTLHPALPPSAPSTPTQVAELWMLCNKWVQFSFVEHSAAHSDLLKQCHPWKVLPTNGQVAKVFSVLNFFPTVWLVLRYPNRKTTLPKALGSVNHNHLSEKAAHLPLLSFPASQTT